MNPSVQQHSRTVTAALGMIFVLSLQACSVWDQFGEADLDTPKAQEPRLTVQDSSDDRAEKSQRSDQPEIDTSGWSRERLFAYFNRLRGDAYPLDALPRHLENADSKVPCLADDQELYRGTQLKFIPLTVHPAFVERLQKIESIVAQEADAFYGRIPSKVVHQGGYACRASRFQSTRISEHAFGNAIDISGFNFAALPKEKFEAVASQVPRGPFQLRISTHWTSKGGAAADLHQEFLRKVANRIVSEHVIRVALGPSHRGHQSHLHFDMSPWRYADL